MKLALDANIVIYAIDAKSPFHAQANAVFYNAPVKGNEIHISELTYLETLAHASLSQAEAAKIYELIRQIATVNWPIDSNVLLQAARLRRYYNKLKTPDAIHLATAIVHVCDYFVTNDKDLLKLSPKEIRLIDLRTAANI